MGARGKHARRRWARVLTLVFVVSALGLVGAGAASAQYDPSDPWALPPETIQRGIKATQFENPDICARCHPQIYRDWTKSMHRQYTNAAFQWAFEQASKDTNGGVDGFCPRCHSPIAVLAGEKITPGQYANLSDIAQKGVQCDFCHVLDKVSPDWPGNGSFHVTPGKVKLGPLKDAESPHHQTAYSELHTRADFCGMCHNVSHPGTHVQLESTYSEWLSSSYAKKGVTCQKCHMPEAKGRASNRGPERAAVSAHTFVGANVRSADASLAVADLKKAASITVEQSQDRVNYGDKVTFSVRVTNKGAGHFLPTGITELRQMWIELRVKDAKGDEVFAEDHMFTTVLEDATGVHDGSVPIWKAVKVYSDNRIAPNATADVPLEWAVPYDLQTGSLRAEATLKYRSLPEEFAKEAGLDDNPVTTMAVAEPMTIELRPSLASRVAAIAVTGFFGIGYLLPLIVLAAWLLFTIWLIAVAWRGRSRVG